MVVSVLKEGFGLDFCTRVARMYEEVWWDVWTGGVGFVLIGTMILSRMEYGTTSLLGLR